MKKLKLIVIVLLAVMLFPFCVSAKEKEPIKVHIFRGDGCQFCAAALNFFESIEDEYGSYFDLVEHEVWSNQDNAALMTDVAAYFDDKVEGIPYIIIGEKTFQGYAESYDEDIKAAIKESYDSGNFEDIVEQIANGTLKADKKEEKNNNTTTIIIIAVALIGFVALFYFARDEKVVEEEVIEEAKKEEVVTPKKEEVKTTPKKNTTKKTTTKKAASSKTTTTKKSPAKKPSTAKKPNSTAKTTAKKTTKK